MFRVMAAVLLSLAGTGGALITPAVSAADRRQPVVLELFTSNSCEKCPPADALMRQLQRSPPPGIEPILLSEHVDYWNPYGWTDRYSSSQFTNRQRAYGRANFDGKIYTPQLIIDGRQSTVGSWEHAVRHAIHQQAGQASRPISIVFNQLTNRTADTQIDFQRAPTDHVSQLWVALIQNHVVSKVGAGENAGRTLLEDGLVRTLRRARATDAAARHYRVLLKLPSDIDPASLAVVAFAQRPTDHAIVGAARRALK